MRDPGPLEAVPCEGETENRICFKADQFHAFYLCAVIGLCPEREGIDQE